MKSKIVVRRASREDIVTFFKRSAKEDNIFIGNGKKVPSIKYARCAEKDGEIVCIGGLVAYAGRNYAFIEADDFVRTEYKFLFILTLLGALRDIDNAGVKYIYALMDPDIPGSEELILRFGFTPISDKLYRRVSGQWRV
jgi:hypothetical protein